MNALLQAKPWNDLHHIGDVEPFNEGDEACLEEIRAVLEKHNNTKRFGIALLHQHFPIGEDEILLETCDIREKTLTISPVNADAAADQDIMATMYRFDNGARYGCSYCKKNHHT